MGDPIDLARLREDIADTLSGWDEVAAVRHPVPGCPAFGATLADGRDVMVTVEYEEEWT